MSKKKNKDAQADSTQPPQEPNQPAEESLDPVAHLQAERDDLFNRLQRVSADYVNYQKRTTRESEQSRQFANELLMKALLAVLDDMERALDVARANHDASDPLLTGMQMVHDKALQTLGQFGLELMDAEGQTFDPDKHQALMRQPTDEVEPMTILQVHQKGYCLKGRVLRPATVVVATAPEAADGLEPGGIDVEA